MRRIRSKPIVLLSALLLLSLVAKAQYPISTNVLLTPPYPTNLDAYVDMLNDGVVSVENSSATSIDVYFEVSIEETSGRLKAASNGILPSPVAIVPGITILTPAEIEDLFTGVGESDFETKGLSPAEQEAFLLSRQIPEGSYKICMRAFDQNGTPLSDPSIDPCTYFDVAYAERPVILTPYDGEEVAAGEFVNISWVHDVFTTRASEIEYSIKILDLTEQNIVNVQDAMLNGGVSPEYEAKVGATTFLGLQNNVDMTFIEGNRYAIRVTAKDPFGNLAFKTGGHSELVVFTYTSIFGDDESEINFLPSPQFDVPETGFMKMAGDPLAFPVSWVHDFEENDTTGLLNTLTYTLKVVDMDTLKITSISQKDFENDTYAYLWNKEVTEEDFVLESDSAHTLVVGHQYAFMLQVASSDDRILFDNDGYSSMVQVIIGSEPEEKIELDSACGPTCSNLPLPDDKVAVDMKSNKDYQIGNLTLRTKKVTKAGEGYDGEGYITLDFMNNVKVNVTFSGLQANEARRIFAGSAEAVYDGEASKEGVVATGAGLAGIDFNAAKAMTTSLRTTKKLVSAIGGKPIGLPIGMDREIGQDKMIVGISEMKISPTEASLTALFSIENPEWGEYVPTLGATGVCFSKDGFGDVVKLYLGEDFTIPLTGESLVLKASESNTADQKGCYAIIDCNGFKIGQLSGEISVPRSMLVPENEEGEVLESGNSKISVSGTFKNTKNFILSASISPSQIPGLEGYSFTMENGYYDASDIVNPTGIIFPQGYERSATGEDWRGVWFGNVFLKAPKDWGFAGESDRTTVGIKNFIKDDVGISVVASAKNLLAIEKGNIEGFAISIDELSLNIIRNEFIEAKVEGNLGMPILAEGQYLPYEGIIDREEIKDANNKTTKTTAMSFSVKPNADGYDLDWIKSKIVFDESTAIMLKSNSKERGVEARLSGELTIGSTVDGLSANRPTGMPEMDLPGIKFEGMEISKMKDLTAKAPEPKTRDNYKEAAFQFKKPVFSFMGVELNQVSDATNPSMSGVDKKPEVSSSKSKKDPKINGFNYNLTAMDFSFGDGSSTASESEIKNGSQANLTIAGEVSLVKAKGDSKTKKEGEGLAISASGGFTMVSTVQMAGTKTTFSFDKFQMDSLSVDASVSVMKIKGKLGFYEGDATFGNGAGGNIDLELPMINVGIDGRFGTKDDFNYWYVFGDVKLGSTTKPVPIATFYNIVSIYGFNGGAYYHMTNRGGATAEVRYVPNKSTLLGLEAGLTMAVTKPNLLWGNITLGAEFSGSGLDKMTLSGDAYILKSDMEERGENDEVEGLEARLRAELNFKDELSLTADMKIYANVAGGLVVGNMRGDEQYLMVQANMDINKSDWSLFMGTPDKRASIRLGIPGLDAGITAQAYLMVGNTEKPAAELPAKIQDLLGKDADAFSGGVGTVAGTRSDGNGFAFGALVEYELNVKASILYADLYAGFGFDLSLQEFNNLVCSNNGGTKLGIDGWYAQGQVYAGLSGDIGLDIDLAFYEGKVSLASLSAVMALQGGFPNPVYATGRARMSYSVLGGLVSGSASFGIDVGEKCQRDIVDPFAGIEFIADISPGNNKSKVSPYVQPKLSMNQDAKEYKIYTPTQNGRKEHRFKIEIASTTIKDLSYGGVVNLSKERLSATEYALRIGRALSPDRKYEITVKLIGEKWENGRWNVLMDSKTKKPWGETKSSSFTTGPLPDNITMNNVKITYPFINEMNYMHGNNYYKTGLLKLYSDVDYLFKQKAANSEEWKDVIRVKFYKAGRLIATTKFVDIKGDVIEFDMPRSIDKNSVYSIKVVRTYEKNPNYRNNTTKIANVSKVNYSTSSDYTVKNKGVTYSSFNSNKPKDHILFQYNFGTSKYYSFSDKIANKSYHKKVEAPYSAMNRYFQLEVGEGFSTAEMNQNIRESNTKNLGKVNVYHSLDNKYYNYVLDEFMPEMRDALEHFKWLTNSGNHSAFKRTFQVKHKGEAMWRARSYIYEREATSLTRLFTNSSLSTYSKYVYFSERRDFLNSTGGPSYRSVYTSYCKPPIVNLNYSSRSSTLSQNEVSTGYKSRGNSTAVFYSPLYSFYEGNSSIHFPERGLFKEISDYWPWALSMNASHNLPRYARWENIGKNFDDFLNPNSSRYSNTPYVLEISYTNPENPSRNGKNSYLYSYKITIR